MLPAPRSLAILLAIATLTLRPAGVEAGWGSGDEELASGAFVADLGALCSSPAECDDRNVCTDDFCIPDIGCIHSPNTVPCDDGNACTMVGTCSGGACIGGPVVDCDDGNVCTTDLCIPDIGCIHSPNTVPCDDGNACTAGDACFGGGCVGGPPPVCNDGNLCTDDFCTPPTGCVNAPNAVPCDDGNVCTTMDACDGAGRCAGGEPLGCDDVNDCTEDGCEPMSGCQHNAEPDGSSCSNGDVCDGEKTCEDGSCLPGIPADCDDVDVCTDDFCDPLDGCQNEPIGGCVDLDRDGTPDATDTCVTIRYSAHPNVPPGRTTDQDPARSRIALRGLNRAEGEQSVIGFFKPGLGDPEDRPQRGRDPPADREWGHPSLGRQHPR